MSVATKPVVVDRVGTWRRWLANQGRRWAALAVVGSLALTGCGRAESDEATQPESQPTQNEYPDGLIGTDDGATPQQGGTLVLASLGQPRALDPATTLSAASTGGTEMINVFDCLMRYDTETRTVVPQLADSVEANDDATEFTVTLRDGVEFSDGTPLNAEAVKWSMDRYTASPSAPEGALWNSSVASITVVDDLTVSITLNDSYPGFVNLLASGPGMIVAESSGDGDDFSPIGAGPFTLESLTMGEAVVLKANPNYWDGAPNLETLRFIYIGAPTGSLEALDAGDAHIALLPTPDLIQEELDEGRHGYLNTTSSWAVSLINASEGRPGEDPRVRKALALAVDPQEIADRAYDGKGFVTNRMFPESSQWYTPDATVPTPDPDEAKQLVEEAKADGFDGNIEYICGPGPQMKDRCLALKAQWDAVGFDVTINQVRTTADAISAGVSKDYDLIQWALNFRESDPYAKFAALMHSTGTQTYGMHTSPEMDALIEEFKQAPDHETGLEVMTRIETKFHEDVPWVSHLGGWDFSTWKADEVHGVVGGSTGMLLLGKAWLA